MNSFFLSLVGIILLSLVGVAGDTLIKISGQGKSFINPKIFIAGLLVYASTAFGWFFVMKYVKFSTLGMFYAISTALFLTLIGILYFKEAINRGEIVGIILGITSLILLSKFA